MQSHTNTDPAGASVADLYRRMQAREIIEQWRPTTDNHPAGVGPIQKADDPDTYTLAGYADQRSIDAQLRRYVSTAEEELRSFVALAEFCHGDDAEFVAMSEEVSSTFAVLSDALRRLDELTGG